jgi:hypothetical protein
MTSRKSRAFLVSLGDTNQLLVPTVGAMVLLTILAIVGFVWGAYVAGSILLLIACAILATAMSCRRLYNEESVSELHSIIYQHLKKSGLQQFDLEQVVEGINVPYEHLKKACTRVYRMCVRQALADFTITEKERKASTYFGREISHPSRCCSGGRGEG